MEFIDSLAYRFDLVYSRDLLRRAVARYWLRSLNPLYLAALLVVAIGLGALLRRGDTSWVVGALATLLVQGIVNMIVWYVVPYRRAMDKLARLGPPKAAFQANESDFNLATEIGTSSYIWPAVTEIWRFQDFWLMFFSPAQFITLPLAGIPDDARAFILERVRAAGGTIR